MLMYPKSDITDAQRIEFLTKLFEGSRSSIVFKHYASGAAGCEAFSVPSQHVRGYSIRGAIDAMMEKAQD